MIRVRLLKVMVHPVFISDDGTKLSQVPTNPAEFGSMEEALARIEEDRKAVEDELNSKPDKAIAIKPGKVEKKK